MDSTAIIHIKLLRAAASIKLTPDDIANDMQAKRESPAPATSIGLEDSAGKC